MLRISTTSFAALLALSLAVVPAACDKSEGGGGRSEIASLAKLGLI
jgi:hypothetical protein